AFTQGTFGYNLDCGPHTYSWDFGDRSEGSSAKAPTHTYSAPGTYVVKMTVNNGGGPFTYQWSLKVDNSIPVTPTTTVSFVVMPITAIANSYAFAATANPSGPVKSWSWDFGDGKTDNVGAT